MAIVGITDADAVLSSVSAVKLGTLKKGSPKAAKKPGQNLDYFRFEPSPDFPELRQIFTDIYGAQPKAIDGVWIDGSNVDQAFATGMYEFNAAKLLVRRCDGEQQNLRLDANTGFYNREPVPCANATPGESCACTRRGTLIFRLEELMREGWSGYIELQTGGVTDIQHIYGLLSQLIKSHGTLDGIPFSLRRMEEGYTYVQQGKGRKRSQTSNVKLIVDPRFELGLRRAQRDALLGVPSEGEVVDTDSLTINAEQRAQLWQGAKTVGMSAEQFRQFFAAKGFRSTVEVLKVQFDGILTEIGDWTPPDDEPAGPADPDLMPVADGQTFDEF